MGAGAFNTQLYNGGSVGTGGPNSVGNLILYRAMRLARWLHGQGQGPNLDKVAEALLTLNGLIDFLSIQRNSIYTVRNDRYTMTPSKLSYTIGIDPTGAQTADFPAVRPVRIDHANIVLTSSAPEVFIPVRLLTDDEWQRFSVRNIAVSIPHYLYNDYNNPISTLYLRGYPTAGYDLELWTWQQLQQYLTADDQIALPPGLLETLVYNLAVKLAENAGTEIAPSIAIEARRTLGKFKALNSPSPTTSSADFGQRRGGGQFNYFTGGPV